MYLHGQEGDELLRFLWAEEKMAGVGLPRQAKRNNSKRTGVEAMCGKPFRGVEKRRKKNKIAKASRKRNRRG